MFHHGTKVLDLLQIYFGTVSSAVDKIACTKLLLLSFTLLVISSGCIISELR